MATNPKPHHSQEMANPMASVMTVEAFEQMPSEDGWIYELHAGRLITMPGPGNQCGLIQGRMYFALEQYLRAHHLGEMHDTCCYNLPLAGNTEEVRCSDLSYSLAEREAIMPLRGSYLVGAPDLVIEVTSPGDTRPMLVEKCHIYLTAGVRLIWVVWPKTQRVDVWHSAATDTPSVTLQEEDVLDGWEVIPGFQHPPRTQNRVCSRGDTWDKPKLARRARAMAPKHLSCFCTRSCAQSSSKSLMNPKFRHDDEVRRSAFAYRH